MLYRRIANHITQTAGLCLCLLFISACNPSASGPARDPSMGTIVGVVNKVPQFSNNKQPVAKVTVRMAVDDEGKDNVTQVTDDAGKFTFINAKPGQRLFSVDVSAGGGTICRLLTFAEAKAGEETSLTIDIPDPIKTDGLGKVSLTASGMIVKCQ